MAASALGAASPSCGCVGHIRVPIGARAARSRVHELDPLAAAGALGCAEGQAPLRRGLAGPGHRRLRPLESAGLRQAAAREGVADGQVGGAAVLLVVAAGRLQHRAAAPGDAHVEDVAEAAAGGVCGGRGGGGGNLG